MKSLNLITLKKIAPKKDKPSPQIIMDTQSFDGYRRLICEFARSSLHRLGEKEKWPAIWQF